MTTKNGVKYRKWLVPSSKYNIKCPYTMDPKKVTLHNTDNEATAHNEISYMRNNNNQTSYHVAIDEAEAIQGLPFNRNGWHSGDGGNGYGNRNTIAFEIARNLDRKRNTTDLLEPLKSYYTKAEQNAIKVIAQIMIEEGIVANNDNIKTHNDWNGKWCPRKILNENRLGAVKQGIIAEYNRLKGKPAPKPVKPSTKRDGHLTLNQVVDKAIAGGYGNGSARKTNIPKYTKFGYSEVQTAINKKLNAVTKPTTPKPKPKPTGTIKKGSKVKIKTSAKTYSTGQTIPVSRKNKTYIVQQTGSKGALIKELYSWVRMADLTLVSGGGTSAPKPSQPNVKIGQTVTATRLYTTEASTKNVRSSSIRGYVDRINNKARNPIRLRNKKGGYYLGFTRKEDIR